MNALLAYLSGLRVSQGRLAGEAFKILPWQRRFVRGAFAPGVQSAALSVARGNGKTALLSGIAAATLDGPLAVPRGETVIVAASFEQARIAFDHVLAFMGDKLSDKQRWRIWDTSQAARIEDKTTGARVRCLGSDPRRAHGLPPVLVLADEPAQWPDNTGERMVAALRTAAGKQPHSRFVALGTRPADPEHWFAKMLAGSADYAQSHAARPDDPKFRKTTWKKANPSLSHMPDLLVAIQSEAQQAKRYPALLASFEALRLNLGTEDAEVSTLLDAGLWRSIEGEIERSGPCVWGIDLGTSAAQSAVAAYWPTTGALACQAAFPSVPSLAERGLRDGVGGLYVECHRRGELLTLGQRSSDVSALLRVALDRFGRPSRVVADRWREAELWDALEVAGVPLAVLECRGQGFKDGAEDVRGFRRACADRHVVPAHRSCYVRPWLRPARSRTLQATPSYPKAARADVGSGRGTMQLRLQSWRWRRAFGSRSPLAGGGATVGWRGDQTEEVELTQEIDWQKWRRQGTDILGESIEFAARIVGTTEKRIEKSRLYGVALLAQSIECARAIRRCIAKELPSPAFALARAQYEGALRGHIIVHEIELEELNAVLGRIGLWVQDEQSLSGLPKIVIRRTEWKIVGLETKYDWRPLQHDIANLFAGWVGSNSRHMEQLHDLAHSGMTHALQMLDEDGNIEPRYSDQNQTLLLELADRAVMFSIMTWPGAQQKCRDEIEERMERTTQWRSSWATTTAPT